MNVHNVELEQVCGNKSQFPTKEFPEIVFAGKSNVGKSSLLNALINRKALARTSSQPGKTRTINFYNVEEQIYFVDVPGYGYAKASKTEVEKWGKFIEDYLKEREYIKNVMLLVDFRHEPGKNDIVMYNWLVHNGFNPVVIATKKDKVNRSQHDKHKALIRKGLNMPADSKLILFSAITKEGKEEIWKEIEDSVNE